MDGTSSEQPKYRTIYVVEPAHDLSALLQYGRDIAYVFNSYEQVDDMMSKAEESMKNFDSAKDAFVPIGRVTACLIAGMVLAKATKNNPVDIGIYKERSYRFVQVALEA